MKTRNAARFALKSSITLTMAMAMFLASARNVAANGTDILHFSVIKTMTDNGIETNAGGVVVATQKEQGNANNQTLSIALTGLSENTPYELFAAIDNDTNVTDIMEFTTDNKGEATLTYRSLGNGKGGGKKNGPLPASLNPVSLIREVDIVNSNAQAVLTADLSTPDKLQYLVKRNLGSDGIKASLQIQANSNRTQFRLTSTGLATNTDYLLAFNGEVVQTNTSSSKGRLNINTLTETPPAILDVRSVELWDTSSNIVLQTELP